MDAFYEFDETQFYDVSFVYGDETIRASRSVLAMYSSVFDEMFANNSVKKEFKFNTADDDDNINEFDSTIVRDFFSHFHLTNAPTTIDKHDSAMSIYTLANIYKFSPLMEKCVKHYIQYQPTTMSQMKNMIEFDAMIYKGATVTTDKYAIFFHWRLQWMLSPLFERVVNEAYADEDSEEVRQRLHSQFSSLRVMMSTYGKLFPTANIAIIPEAEDIGRVFPTAEAMSNANCTIQMMNATYEEDVVEFHHVMPSASTVLEENRKIASTASVENMLCGAIVSMSFFVDNPRETAAGRHVIICFKLNCYMPIHPKTQCVMIFRVVTIVRQFCKEHNGCCTDNCSDTTNVHYTHHIKVISAQPHLQVALPLPSALAKAHGAKFTTRVSLLFFHENQTRIEPLLGCVKHNYRMCNKCHDQHIVIRELLNDV